MEQYPTEVQVTPPHRGPPPHTDKLQDITINTTVPYPTTKYKHSNESNKAFTLAMFEERYPQEAWIRVFTYGSAARAVWRGGAGVHRFPDGQKHSEAIPAGL